MTTVARGPVGVARGRLRALLERDEVRNAILAVIVLNAITLGLATSKTVSESVGPLLGLADRAVVAIFIVEIGLKLIAYGRSFFRSGWNVFDLMVVLVSVAPPGENISALRGLRVIRALRILSIVPQMRAVVQALIDALPGMGAVMVLLGIVYYVCAVIATMLYGGTFPDWFGTIGASLYSLFQIMTLESWSMGIVRTVMEQHPYAWLFFVPFIITTAFAVLNLFIGLLVNTLQSAVEAEKEQEMDEVRAMMRAENAVLAARIDALREEIRALCRDGRT